MTSLTSASKNLRLPLLGLALASLALSGCSGIRESFGLERQSPDEFTVVSRAPLSLPPDMRNLPEPRPGAPRPQEIASNRAAETVFGAQRATGAGSAGEQVLLSQAAPTGVEPGIRNKIDQETTALIVADKSWVDSLLFWRKDVEPAELVDPAKENQRLRQVQAEGRAINDGQVPTIERKRRAPLEGLF